MIVCYKVYNKSQLLGNHHETEPTGPFCSSLGMFLLQCSAYKPSTAMHNYRLTGSRLLPQELLRSPFHMTLIKQRVENCSDIAITTTTRLQRSALLPSGLQQTRAEACGRQSVTRGNDRTCLTSPIFTFFLATWV